MNPYSHLVVASRLKGFIKPADPSEYYWGSIVADIRYLAGLRRQQTHLSTAKILELMVSHLSLRPFLQGYLVHLLCDEIDLGGVFCRYPPFSILKDRFSRQHYAVMLELYCFEKEKVCAEIVGTHNRVLEEMGIDQSMAVKFAESLNRYQAASASETRLQELFSFMGLQGDPRIDKYLQAALKMQKDQMLKSVVFLSLRAWKLLDELVEIVKRNPCWEKI